MKPHTAAAILAVVDAHGLPRTKEKAEPVIQAWLRSHDAKLDRWGNYHLSDGKRVKFQERVVRVEEKTQYGWVARQSSSYVDMALILTKKASEAAGRGDVLQKAVKTRSTRKAASERGAVARKAVYEVKNGPGYYVTNGYVGGGMSLKMRVADHDKPFSNLDDAIAMAERKYRELVGMKFHYLLPVQVVKTEDRFHAEHPVANALGKKGENVYWQDGHKIEHVNPNQAKLPGMAKGTAKTNLPLASLHHLGGALSEWQGPGTPGINHVASYFIGGHQVSMSQVRLALQELRALSLRMPTKASRQEALKLIQSLSSQTSKGGQAGMAKGRRAGHCCGLSTGSRGR